MFDIGWSEMAIILLIALIVIGPRDLPRVARTLGQWVRKGRALAREFQSSLEDMAREAELDKVKNEIEKAGRTDVKRSVEKTIDPEGDLGRAFDPKDGGSKDRKDRKAKTAKTGAGAAGKPETRADRSDGAEPKGAADEASGSGREPQAAEREKVPAETT